MSQVEGASAHRATTLATIMTAEERKRRRMGSANGVGRKGSSLMSERNHK